MPMGWTTTSWPCLTQLKTYVELCPATLTSISTLTLDRFGSRRPWADGCGSARLRSTLSVAIFGSLAAAAVMHARSSTETSPGWPGPLGLPVPPGLPVPASRARSSTEGSCATAIQARTRTVGRCFGRKVTLRSSLKSIAPPGLSA